MSDLGNRLTGLFHTRSRAAQGALLMACATFCFVAMQTMARHVGQSLPPFEVAFFRNLFGLFALAPLFLRYGLITPLRTDRIGLHFLRSGLQSGGMLAFFTGLTLIPLTQVTALSFAAPLVGSVLAVLILGERVRARRISALVIGFVGVLIVLRPGFAEVSLGAMLIIGSTLGWGSAMIVIKVLSRTDSSMTQTDHMGVFMTPLTLVPALFVWQWPTPEQYMWLMLIGVAGTLGHLAFAQSFKLSEATAVLPLDFLRLLWASLAGYVVFSELPDMWAWIGGAIIFSSATYIAYREARLAAQRRAAEGAGR